MFATGGPSWYGFYEHTFAVPSSPHRHRGNGIGRLGQPTCRGGHDNPRDRSSSMSELTPRQREILEVIERSVRERGYPPSVREIGARSASPPRPPSTPTWPRSSGSGYLRQRPDQATRHRGALRPVVRRRGRTPPGPPRAARRRRRRRNRRARPGERRGGPARPGRSLRRGRPVHASGPGRLDDRCRHPRRRLRRRQGPGDGREGRRRGRRHPRRGGHRQDLQRARPARSCSCRPTRGSSRCRSTRTTSRSSGRWSPCCAGSEPIGTSRTARRVRPSAEDRFRWGRRRRGSADRRGRHRPIEVGAVDPLVGGVGQQRVAGAEVEGRDARRR